MTTTCTHGQPGVCLINRPDLAGDVDVLHRLAYDYAISVGLDRGDAETFAGWITGRCTGPGGVDLDRDLRDDLAAWTDIVRPVR